MKFNDLIVILRLLAHIVPYTYISIVINISSSNEPPLHLFYLYTFFILYTISTFRRNTLPQSKLQHLPANKRHKPIQVKFFSAPYFDININCINEHIMISIPISLNPINAIVWLNQRDTHVQTESTTQMHTNPQHIPNLYLILIRQTNSLSSTKNNYPQLIWLL